MKKRRILTVSVGTRAARGWYDERPRKNTKEDNDDGILQRMRRGPAGGREVLPRVRRAGRERGGAHNPRRTGRIPDGETGQGEEAHLQKMVVLGAGRDRGGEPHGARRLAVHVQACGDNNTRCNVGSHTHKEAGTDSDADGKTHPRN